MTLSQRALLITALMVLAIAGSSWLRPIKMVADVNAAIDLELMIPEAFGQWRALPHGALLVVDPQQQETISKIYSQTLARTYVNDAGYQVMLSIAYGSDQRDSLQFHKPEFCYPAQGFAIDNQQSAFLESGKNPMPIKRMLAIKENRREPVTYWMMVGETAVQSGLQKKIVEMRHSWDGLIPDGMIVRASSIDSNESNAYGVQAQFLAAMLDSIPDSHRVRFGGRAGS